MDKLEGLPDRTCPAVPSHFLKDLSETCWMGRSMYGHTFGFTSICSTRALVREAGWTYMRRIHSTVSMAEIFSDKPYKATLDGQVLPITAKVLGHQDYLFGPTLGKCHAFGNNLFHRLAYQRPPDGWDKAVVATVVASLTHLYIRTASAAEEGSRHHGPETGIKIALSRLVGLNN